MKKKTKVVVFGLLTAVFSLAAFLLAANAKKTGLESAVHWKNDVTSEGKSACITAKAPFYAGKACEIGHADGKEYAIYPVFDAEEGGYVLIAYDLEDEHAQEVFDEATRRLQDDCYGKDNTEIRERDGVTLTGSMQRIEHFCWSDLSQLEEEALAYTELQRELPGAAELIPGYTGFSSGEMLLYLGEEGEGGKSRPVKAAAVTAMILGIVSLLACAIQMVGVLKGER